MSLLPTPFIRLINALKRLPGVGEKTATRYAMAIFDAGSGYSEQLMLALKDMNEGVKRCEVCNNLAEGRLCTICQDEDRDPTFVCVVKDIRDLIAMEQSGGFKGRYHVLGGLISPLRGVMPGDLAIGSLVQRCKNNPDIQEVVVALDATVEGDTTALYIKEQLSFLDITVSRPAMGIPTGTDIGYLDAMTLDRALKDRKNL